MKRTLYDVAVIGAGVVGVNLARQLSRYTLKVIVFDAKDVASGSTRANSGIVHGGYSAKAGTRKAEFCFPGNRQFPQLARELNFPFKLIGSVVLAFNDQDMETLTNLRDNGRKNGVQNLEIVGTEEVLRRVPRANPAEIKGGLFCNQAGIVSPYEFAVALAENALMNGVAFQLYSPVTAIAPADDSMLIEAGGREYYSRFVVNAAGVGAAEIADMLGPSPFHPEGYKGQYIVLRRGSGTGLNKVIFQPPTDKGKGILVTPTTWNNVMVGPDSRYTENPLDLGTDPESLARIFRTALRSVVDIDPQMAIRVFSGIRPAANRRDFIIEWSSHSERVLHLAGIESPGLTASPAIASEAVRMLKLAGLELIESQDFNPLRRAALSPRPLGNVAKAATAANLPPGAPGRILCRCEQILEQEVRDAIHRGLPIYSLDAVKRRSRAGMGACQGTFCGPRVRDLLAAEMNLSAEGIEGPTRDRNEILHDLEEMRRILSTARS